MSRETDTPSSGPNGRGGAAYPSGTPPYGTPTASGDGTDAGRSGARPEERKTETTLTTRIRINIPGSRPIPPVVVRKPVTDAESANGSDTDAEASAPGAATSTRTAEPPAEPDRVDRSERSDRSAEEKATSDWFAPRKSPAVKGGQGGGSTNGAGLPGGSDPSGPGAGASASGAGPSGAGGARPGAGRPGGVVGSMSVPGGSRTGGASGARPGTAGGTSRPGGTNGAGLPGATGGPVAPGHGGGTGSFDVTEALAAGPLGNGSRSGPGTAGGAEPRRDDLPYFAEDTNGGQRTPHAQGGPNGQAGHGGPGDAGGIHEHTGHGGPQGGPAGPTSGPVTGDGPILPPAGGAQSGPGGPGMPGGYDEPGRPGGPGGYEEPGRSSGPGGYDESGRSGMPGGYDEPGRPGGPGGYDEPRRPAGPRTPGMTPGAPAGLNAPGHPGPGGGMSDDTAILTPQKPVPEPDGPGYGPRHDNVSGHTVTSGIPVVPSGPHTPFGPGAPGDGPQPHTPPKLPEPVAAPPASSSKPPKKKGRNKLVLLGGGVIALAGLAYGAGLLMNHSDVPKGTTVLGVDIGGGTRDEAVKKLNEAFDGRVNKPLKLSVGGRTVELEPDQAGLQFDMQATVDAAAGSDYNPVSVIGSLFGNHRVVAPDMPVDEEKLHAALRSAAGGTGSVTDGTIKFRPGKAVAVYGKPGKGIDVDKATQAVEEAYRTQVETDSSSPVTVPTTTQQPTVPNSEVDRMMKEFAKPAMSGLVTVKTDTGKQISFSPQNSLWKFLGVKAQNGKLVEYYDRAALKALYGDTFDGVLVNRGTGQKTPVTVEDVISALRPALKSTTDRVAVIDTDPS
ncbi:hypothetical protein AB0K80_05795 [Streptomyces sp. NPDC052682]|uniref:hypothetical protein n=1 Tax=Streptomyces sp. NPDC052682 TaxID=3154954 RepID=UPI00344509AF